MMRKVWFFNSCLLFLFNLVSVLSFCKENSLYTIRSTVSPLVLDAGDGKLTIEHFHGHSLQLWKFKMGSKPGLFYIVNSDSGKVLDVDRANENRVVLSAENNSLEQQWTVNHNGRIANAALKKNLDIVQGKYVPGNPVIVWVDNGNTAQEFMIKEKLLCCPSICNVTNSDTDKPEEN